MSFPSIVSEQRVHVLHHVHLSDHVVDLTSMHWVIQIVVTIVGIYEAAGSSCVETK